MKIFTRCFVALLTVSTLITLAPRPAAAQIGPGMGQSSGPQIPPALQKEVEALQKLGMELQKTITPDQKKKIDALQAKFQKQAQDVMAPYMKKYGPNASATDKQKAQKEMQPKMMKIQTEAEKAIKGVMTAKQVAMLSTLETKQKALMAKMQQSAPKK
jgi:uncharacterized protein YdiU (UPF0061 family)